MLHFLNLGTFVLAQEDPTPLTPTVDTVNSTFPSESTIVNELGMVFKDDPRGYPTEVGSFFDFESYLEGEPCYAEIMSSSGNIGITKWSSCCSQNASSVNCVNYNAGDVCFDAVRTGEDGIAIYAGKFGWYPTTIWATCCSYFCEDDLICNNSLYCRSYAEGWEQWWPSWLYYCVVVSSFFFFMSMILIALCCCGVCGMSRGVKRSNQHKAFTEGVQPYQQPQIVYIQADRQQTQPVQFAKAAEVPQNQPITLVKQSSVQVVGGSDSDDTNVVLKPYHNI